MQQDSGGSGPSPPDVVVARSVDPLCSWRRCVVYCDMPIVWTVGLAKGCAVIDAHKSSTANDRGSSKFNVNRADIDWAIQWSHGQMNGQLKLWLISDWQVICTFCAES